LLVSLLFFNGIICVIKDKLEFVEVRKMDFVKVGQELVDKEILKIKNFMPIKKWTDFPLIFTVEFIVSNYFEEIGFWRSIFGMEFLSTSQDYSILKHPENDWTFSIKKNSVGIEYKYNNIKIQLYTDNLDASCKFIDDKKYPYEIYEASENQRYALLKSPAGVIIEVWSGWEEK